jgi:thiamine biosynthesis lipoprotein
MAGTLTRRNFLSLDFGDRRAAGDHWVRVHRVAMACRFEVMLSSDDAIDVEAARAALDEADEIESMLTVFREQRSLPPEPPGRDEAITVGADLFALFSTSALHRDGQRIRRNCTPLSRCWGFLSEEGRVPTARRSPMRGRSSAWATFRLDPARRSVRFAGPGVELNFGAIGKGYALDRMGELLRARGARRALLSAGRSSVLALGGKGRGWPVDLRPRLASRRVGRLWIKNGAVGTSGAGEQFIEIDGRRYGRDRSAGRARGRRPRRERDRRRRGVR